MTIKMIKSTRSTSIRGVTLIFGVAPAPPDIIAISTSPFQRPADNNLLLSIASAFFLVCDEADLIDVLFPDRIDRLNNLSVIYIDTALDINNSLIGRLVFPQLFDLIAKSVDRNLFLSDVEITVGRDRDHDRRVLGNIRILIGADHI